MNIECKYFQNETIIEASALGQSKSAAVIEDENTFSGGAILISRNDGIAEMSHSQETQNTQNGKSEEPMFTRVSLSGTSFVVLSATFIIRQFSQIRYIQSWIQVLIANAICRSGF